eukprot:140443-Chlamydomonas_euryale.AAC.2
MPPSAAALCPSRTRTLGETRPAQTAQPAQCIREVRSGGGEERWVGVHVRVCVCVNQRLCAHQEGGRAQLGQHSLRNAERRACMGWRHAWGERKGGGLKQKKEPGGVATLCSAAVTL